MPRNKSQKDRWQPKDNKTLLEKSHLRKEMIARLRTEPCVLETHGGTGELFLRCYSHVKAGAVFETDPKKAVTLLKQRPTWAVYETDCIWSLHNGVASHLDVNFVDFDPYGGAWDVIQAFFESERPRAETLIIVVHDGIRGSLKRFGGGRIGFFSGIVEQVGEIELYQNYLSVCEKLLFEIASKAGYKAQEFGGFYSKQDTDQTHFFAELYRSPKPQSFKVG